MRTVHPGMASSFAIAALVFACFSPRQAGGSEGLAVGVVVDLGGRTATINRLDSLPQVDSDYTRRFKYDSFENPKLKELRTRYGLDEVVAAGKDELDRQVLLMDWAHRQFKKFGQPSIPARGALEILQGIENGQTFFCSQYEQLLVSAAASLGWVDRPLALRRHQGVARVGGSTEHSVTEIWSNQHAKWVMLDPTSNMYLEREGVPLNAFEIRQEWFYHDGTNLVFVIGRDRKKYRKSDLPVFLEHFDNFGDLAVYPDELDKYGFIGYIPNTDLMDSGFAYDRMFIVKDQLCDGTQWHVRDLPKNPAVDPYFPIDQTALSLAPDEGKIRVGMRTLTPNFQRYEIQIDGGGWKSSRESFYWNLHDGRNRIEARVQNQFGVIGPVSTVVVEVTPSVR